MRVEDQKQLEQERLRGVIAQSISQSIDLTAILEMTVTKVREFLQTDRVIIYRFNPDGSGVVVAESVEAPWTSTIDKTIADSCFQKNWVELYKQGRVKAIANIHTANLNPCHVELLAKYQVQASMIVPILQCASKDWDTPSSKQGQEASRQDQLWGLLIAHHCSHPRQWEPRETDLFFSVSIQIALAIQQAQAEVFRQQQMASQLSKLNRSVRMLLECNKLLVQATEESELLQAICQSIITRGGYQLAWIGLIDTEVSNHLKIKAQAFEPGEFESPPFTESGLATFTGDFITEAICTSEPALTQNLKLQAADVQQEYDVAIASSYVQSAIALPLQSDSVSGVLTIYSKHANTFDVAEVELLKELAETLSHGLMNLRARSLLKQTNERLESEISERQRAKAAFLESYNLLNTVIDTTQDAVFVKDLKGRYLLMNLPGALLFNKLPEEIIGQDDAHLFPPEVAAQIQANDQRIIAFKTCQILEESIFIQGEMRTYLASKTAYRSPEGKILGIVGFSKDITALKLTEMALHQANEELEQRVLERTAELKTANTALADSEERLRLFIENVPSAIAMFDRQMRYLALSKCWLTDYNLSEQNIIGCSHYEVFPEISDKWKEYHAQVLAGAIIKSEEDLFIRADGTKNWIRYELHPWYNVSGEVGGLIMFTEVITQRKEAELQLRQINQELTRSNQELEQFAYVASHDLQEPLRKIKSYTELLAENYLGAFDNKADKYITYITDGATRMQALISDLLTYSRLGRNNPKMKAIALETVVEQTLLDLSNTIEESNAVITVTSLPTVQANPLQMAQLFQNIITNALKFKGKTTPKIHIEAKRQQQEWVISVSDNGIGIKPQYAERIFEIFQRLHSRDKYPGTGIGLAICRKIVEYHSGRIWVESEIGCGTTFYFTLPVICSLP